MSEDGAATMIQAHVRAWLSRKEVKRLLTISRRSRAGRPKLDPTADKEIMDLFIQPDVKLDLQVSYPTSTTMSRRHILPVMSAGRYAVKGPAKAVNILATLRKQAANSAGSSTDEFEGFISPKSGVTLPDDVKRDAGIPLAASDFAFIYPLRAFRGQQDSINLAEHSWAFALLIGAFAYFDEVSARGSRSADDGPVGRCRPVCMHRRMCMHAMHSLIRARCVWRRRARCSP